RSAASILSVTVGTSTSAVLTASPRSAALIGLSSALRRTSNSSRILSSIASGSLRVTTTTGFFCFTIGFGTSMDWVEKRGVQGSLTALAQTAAVTARLQIPSVSYQMAETTQSVRRRVALKVRRGLAAS